MVEVEELARNLLTKFMPRRSIWKGSFVDAFLLRMKKKRDLLLNRNIRLGESSKLMGAGAARY
jgi:hypothetical protein